MCSEMDIEMGIERESNKSEKMGKERERERVCKGSLEK